MASEEPLVLMEGLEKSFPGMPRPALQDVSGAVPPGGITGLVGPDGAGKSTLIRLLVGLLLPDAGKASVAGYDTRSQAGGIHSICGYMPQKFGLYEDLSVMENLRLYAELRGVTGREREKKFSQLLKFTNLGPFETRLAGKLSGGMKQKLGLACALLGQPKVLLLDEPSVGVDPISRRELWAMVQELLTEGMAVVWSTAYLDEAEKCDSVILLNDGKVLYSGPPERILDRVRDRTWQISGIAENKRREVLMQLQQSGDVTDAVIQGASVRLVCRPQGAGAGNGESGVQSAFGASAIKGGEGKGERPGIGGELGKNAVWKQAEPRFEDAFIDILGGGPTGVSALGASMREKPPSDAPVIEAEKLTKRFGAFTAVKDNSFRIGRGEIFGLLGPNGAGKSTTFKMLCGLLKPSSGSASIMGIDLGRSSSKARSRIGYMAQKFSLYNALSVSQNLKFFSGVYGLSGRGQDQAIELMVSLFSLAPYLDMTTEALPLGFKQRLALACAVMHSPDVLFLDEPTSGVDPVTRREFWMHINAMVQKGVTVMVTTHFMDEAEYCDRIALIYHGENIASGTPEELKAMVRSGETPDPSLEDAFIALVRRSEDDSKN